MIIRKTAKGRTKRNSLSKVENKKQTIASRLRATTTLSCITRTKSAKLNLESDKTKQNKTKRVPKRQQINCLNGEVKCSPRKNISSTSRKSTKINKIKDIVKKGKTKANNKIKKVLKKKTREKKKVSVSPKMNKSNGIDKNGLTKLNSDRTPLNKDKKKTVLKNGISSSKSSVSGICMNFVSSLNRIKSIDEKQLNNKKADVKNKRKPANKCEERECNSDAKMVRALKISKKATKDSTNGKKKQKTNHISCKESKKGNTLKEKGKIKTSKRKEKNECDSDKMNKSVKNGLIVKRGHRLASLNAIAKVRLLCENERERNDSNETVLNDYVKHNLKKEKINQRSTTKLNEKNVSNKDCKALVAVDNSKKQIAVRKRKMIDDSIEIIDTRSCKRMASLNASAIMAASYSPERIKRSKSSESARSSGSVEMVREMKISSTVAHIEISPTISAINGIRVSKAKSVILKAQNHETIETVNNLKMSSKIKERLMGIARLESFEEEKKKRKTKNKSNDSLSRKKDNTNGEVSGFKATKVQVTKVTHINTSQEIKSDKDKKSGHKIESILERDSSVVHKYQVQTKSTIQMETTFNPSTASNLASMSSIASPQISQTGATPRLQLHISATPAQVIPTPILSTSSGQPTYVNFASGGPFLQLQNNQYQTMTSSGSHLNPMSIVNFGEPYPTHYTSAFSVPHFAAHPHPQTPFNYFYPGFYQPAGPLLQPLHDPCLIHKPIPFHPQTPQTITQANHISQFPSVSLQNQNQQTFQNEISQPFTSATQFYQQLPNDIRPPQTVYFQTLPQSNSSMTPSATFALLNSNVHYTHPTIINSEQFTQNAEVDQLCSGSTGLNTSSAIPATEQSVSNSMEYLCKGIQCSPSNKDNNHQMLNIAEKPFDTTDGSPNDGTISMSNRSHMNKKLNKFDNSVKRKKSLLLKPQTNQKTSTDLISDESQLLMEEQVSHSSTSAAKSPKSTLTPSHVNKTNLINKSFPQTKVTKTLCVPVISLPTVSLPRLMPSRKQGKKRYSHGWSWEGESVEKFIYINNEEQPFLRKAYPAIRHNEGDIIKARDCVLLRSGPRKTDLPFVAKIAALWETPEGEMMMSLLWYYRPEHTDLEYYSNQMNGEIFASKHRDTNSVACIDDKCYVLTYSEFCRYQRLKLLKKSPAVLASTIVPQLDEPYPRADRLPPMRTFPELVFCCRKVYDYRQKRILKNPI